MWTNIFLRRNQLLKRQQTTQRTRRQPFSTKRALLKNVITPTKNKEYQILDATKITYNDGTIRRTLSRMEILEYYNRANKVITMSPTKIITLNETKLSCTTIKKILTPQLYKKVIMQQHSTEEQPQEKKEELPHHIDEENSVKTGFEFFRYFTFLFLNISFQYCGSI